MPRPPKVRPLPQPERRASLAKYLEVLEHDPELAHFRSLVPAPQRQLALFAALERAALRGPAAVSPPSVHDVADQLLCDILDAIDRNPKTKDYGRAYGSDRHRVNLQALGEWNDPPRHGELFATAFSHLSAGAIGTLPACEANFSPDPQESGPIGELIGPENAPVGSLVAAEDPPQVIVSLELTPSHPCQPATAETAEAGGLIRHEAAGPGEQLPASQEAGQTATTGRGFEPMRPVRRGRPSVLNDVAKGRLLGLMSYGLSFRQAAAQLGVHHQTLLNALKRDEEFAQQVAEARFDAISQPLLVVVQAARKNWRAAAWLTRFLHDRRTSGHETTPEEREVESKRR